ncbi:MAG: hypothetical protein M3018_07100 [Actinomycetota bacterium]|nr:hypothetical protein [Actinomycetota bacterium]
MAADFASPVRAPTAVPEVVDELVAVPLADGCAAAGLELVDEEPQPTVAAASKPDARTIITARVTPRMVRI